MLFSSSSGFSSILPPEKKPEDVVCGPLRVKVTLAVVDGKKVHANAHEKEMFETDGNDHENRTMMWR